MEGATCPSAALGGWHRLVSRVLDELSPPPHDPIVQAVDHAAYRAVLARYLAVATEEEAEILRNAPIEQFMQASADAKIEMERMWAEWRAENRAGTRYTGNWDRHYAQL